MTQKPVESLDFEQSMEELDSVVKRLETGDLPLADALASYQRGAALMRHAQDLLNRVQTEIEVIESAATSSLDRSALISQVKES